LNLHGITTTRPSTWRVCQFRHSRGVMRCDGIERPGHTEATSILDRFSGQSSGRAETGLGRSRRALAASIPDRTATIAANVTAVHAASPTGIQR